MSRKHKIIISISGIFVVLLALLGITYGYFATKIQGNTNDTSIDLTTANLRLTYADGNGIISATNINPSDTGEYIQFVDSDGMNINYKTFSVTNNGELPITYEIYLEDVMNNFVNYDDLKLEVVCSSNILSNSCNHYNDIFPLTNKKLISNTIEKDEIHTYKLRMKFIDDGYDQSDDMGKSLNGKIQIYDPQDVIAITGEVTNYTEGDYVELHSNVKTSEIKQEVVDGTTKYTYIFYGVEPEEIAHTIYIKNRLSDKTIGSKTISVSKGITQSIVSDASSIVIDDNSTTATVNITISENKDSITLEGKDLNPYEKGTLAYEIYQNRAIVQEYTKDGETYTKSNLTTNKDINELTTITAIADGTVLSDNGLFKAEDDYGPSYIYRGSIINNYVDFAGFTWRIVRINGDGSVRLILDGTLDKICVEYADDETTCNKYAGTNSYFNRSRNDNAYVGYTYGQAGITEGNGDKTAYDLTHEYTGDKTNTNDKTGQSTIKQTVDTFYKTYLLNNYHDYISDILFCGDKSLTESSSADGYNTQYTKYSASDRLWGSVAEPNLKCIENNTLLTESQKAYSRYTVSGNDINGIKTNDDLIYPIALLSADELVMSGAFKNIKNEQYYLYNLNTVYNFWWTMTPHYFNSYSYVYRSKLDNSISFYNVYSSYGIRPVINLSYTQALYDDGDGTELDPYIVKLAS